MSATPVRLVKVKTTEQTYMRVANLTRLRMALAVLRHVVPGPSEADREMFGMTERELQLPARLLSRLEARLARSVDT